MATLIPTNTPAIVSQGPLSSFESPHVPARTKSPNVRQNWMPRWE